MADAPHRLFINGAWVEAPPDGATAIVDPATEETLGWTPETPPEMVARALRAAREAFDDGPWPALSPKDRSALLAGFHAALAARREEIARLVTAETGAVSRVAEALHVGVPLQQLEFWVDAAGRDWSTSIPVTVAPGRDGRKAAGGATLYREPAGVVAAITPFNFPFFLNIWKVGPALAMGNTVVLKPSPYTPLEALVVAEAAEAAGLPPGVLNVVTGGAEVGRRLATDRAVDMVSFTGSDRTGSAVMAQAAEGIKRVLLELGGKSAVIVRADADLDAAAAFGVAHLTIQAGQACAACTRHLVHRSVSDEYLDRLADLTAKITVGDPRDPACGMGPLIREGQRRRVESFVSEAVAAGGRVIVGGGRPAQLEKGFFYEPTVVTDVDNAWPIAQEEIFGPVGVVVPFDDDTEALRLANDSRYGLSGAIFSRDAGTAMEMARRIRTGTVQINGGAGTNSALIPFGGFKSSGLGRELGVEGLLEYTETKAVTYRIA